jgi:hypothetical protein
VIRLVKRMETGSEIRWVISEVITSLHKFVWLWTWKLTELIIFVVLFTSRAWS